MTSEVNRHTMLADTTINTEEVRKAQRAAGRNASDREELVMFLSMLGLLPGQNHPARITE